MFKLTVITLVALCCTLAFAADDPCDLGEFCTPKEVLKCVRSVKFDSTYYKEIINDIITIIEQYVYSDILKNPPQPEGLTDYFEPVDLIAELKNVKTEDVSFYDFYREAQGILMKAQDGHFVFSFAGNEDYDNKISNFYLTPPLVLSTSTNSKGEAVMKGSLITSDFSAVYENFANGAKIKAMVEKNANVAITSINNMSPFDYVLNIGSIYHNYPKNKDAKYTYASRLIQMIPGLYYYPLTEEELSITVVYENGDSFTSDFYFLNLAALQNSKKRGIGNNNDIIEFAREKIRNNVFNKPFGYMDVIESFNSGEKSTEPLTEKEAAQSIKSIDVEKIKTKVKTRAISPATESADNMNWDYTTYDNVLKCRVDDANKVNVYVVTSFSPSDTDNFAVILYNCAMRFEGNSYPIIVVDDYNSGGYVTLSAVFQEFLQPDMISRSYFSFKVNDKIRKAFNTIIKLGIFNDADTCESISKTNDLMKNPITDDFGNGVSHTRTRPVLLEYTQARNFIDSYKSNFKNRRKPTEIVVFTDSYSFSSGSFFTKGLREAGGAIIAGYNGYPGSPKETFDIGQSPTTVMSTTYARLFSPDEYDRLEDKGIWLVSISYGETFRLDDYYSGKSPLVPREFLFDAADERLPLYGGYSDSIYDSVVAAGKQILQKYETECNPDNPKLRMRSEDCDAVINRTHMHGGYTCGADGKWSTTCEGYYCDDGYYFNSYTNECVEETCAGSFSSGLSVSALVLFFSLILTMF